MNVREYTESRGFNPASLYSKIKTANKRGGNFPYPPQEPFSQYDVLLTKPQVYKTNIEKWISRQTWENPDKTELLFLRKLLKNNNKEIPRDIELELNNIRNRDIDNPYMELYREIHRI